MKPFSLRIDDDLYEMIQQRATERGIKVTRYVRMLIEKGLVVDHQLHHGTQSLAESETYSNGTLAELLAENTMVLRSIYRNLFKDEESFKASMESLHQLSQRFLEKLKERNG